jgi:hypothetical protein
MSTYAPLFALVLISFVLLVVAPRRFPARYQGLLRSLLLLNIAALLGDVGYLRAVHFGHSAFLAITIGLLAAGGIFKILSWLMWSGRQSMTLPEPTETDDAE